MENRISYAGQMTRLTSRAQWILLILAAANGAFLYLLPGRAATDYAWAIKPSISAAFMGAGYLAGLVASVLGLQYARRWRSVRGLVWPFLGLGLVMTIATGIHEDRFRWSYALTWLWTVVYIGIPPVALWLWTREERIARAQVEEDPSVHSLRSLASFFGSVLLTLAVLLFLLPQQIAGFWPWPITPLIARVFAAWHVLMGGILLGSAFCARRFHELPIPYLTVCSWSALLCLLPLLHGESLLNPGSSLLWLSFQFSLFLFSGSVALRALRAMRLSGQQL